MKIIALFVFVLLVVLQACGFKITDINFDGFNKTAQTNVEELEIPSEEEKAPRIGYMPLSTKGKQVFAYLILSEAISENDSESVIRVASDLIQLNADPEAIADAASYLMSNNLTDETEMILTKAVAFYPANLPIHAMLAEALMIQKKNKQAIAVFVKFLERYPTDYNAKKDLALTYLKADMPKEAYETFNSLPKSEQTPTTSYYTALALRKLNRIDEAIALLEKAQESSPDFIEILLELARMEELKNNYQAARNYYEKVMAIDSYGHDLSPRLAILAIKENDLDKALELTEQASNKFSFIVGVSSSLMDEKKTDLIDKYLTTLSKTYDDENNELKYLKGALAYEGYKDYAKAIEYFSAIKPKDPHYKKALGIIVQIYLEQDNLDQALATLKTSITAFPDDKSYANLIAQIYMFKGEYALAKPYLQEFLAKNPDDTDAGFQYAVAYSKLGEEDKALDLMENLLKKDPQNHDVLNFIGYTLVERKERLDYALGLIEKAYALQPDAGYITDSLAWAHYRLQNYEEAWIYIKKAVALIQPGDNQDPALWDHYGDIAFSLGKKDEAKKGWERSLRIKKDETVLDKLNKL